MIHVYVLMSGDFSNITATP